MATPRELWLRKGLGKVWYPADDEADDWTAKHKVGDVIRCTRPAKPRNPKHHRKFFALIRLIFRNQELFPTEEKLRKEVLIAAGFFDEWVSPLTGEVRVEAQSLAFDKMDQDTFDDAWNRCCDVIAVHVIPGLDKTAAEREVAEMIGIGAFYGEAA